MARESEVLLFRLQSIPIIWNNLNNVLMSYGFDRPTSSPSHTAQRVHAEHKTNTITLIHFTHSHPHQCNTFISHIIFHILREYDTLRLIALTKCWPYCVAPLTLCSPLHTKTIIICVLDFKSRATLCYWLVFFFLFALEFWLFFCWQIPCIWHVVAVDQAHKCLWNARSAHLSSLWPHYHCICQVCKIFGELNSRKSIKYSVYYWQNQQRNSFTFFWGFCGHDRFSFITLLSLHW